MLPRSTRPPVASCILYQASGVSAQATLCFLSLACSRAISLSHSISISLSLADGQQWTGALMGSDGEARCNCVPLHAVVCNCVICAHTPAHFGSWWHRAPVLWVPVIQTDKRKKSVAAQSVRALRLLRAMRLQQVFSMHICIIWVHICIIWVFTSFSGERRMVIILHPDSDDCVQPQACFSGSRLHPQQEFRFLQYR